MSITLAALIMVASILLYIGTSVILKVNTFIDDKNKELNGSDFLVMSSAKYEELVSNTIKELGKCVQLEKSDTISIDSTAIKNVTQHEKKQTIAVLLFNADKKYRISKFRIIDKGSKKEKNSIILPYYLKVAKGYKTGDEIEIINGNEKNKYIIYGFAEDIMFATPSNISVYKCYVYQDEFNRMYQKANDSSKSVVVKAKLEKGTNSQDYSANFTKIINKKVNVTENSIHPLEYDTMKVGVGIFVYILMTLMIVFSVIIILIALTVIRFAIVTYIEGNIKNIGSMEAIGYVAKQIILSTVLQFFIITLIGSAIGFILAVSGTGIVTKVISSSIGLQWVSRFNITAFIISFVFITLLVLGITYLTAAKIRRITPIMALRDGIDTHNFKKNHFPLSKSSLNVNMAVGLKAFMQNTKQNITLFIVVSLMSFVSVLVLVVNYNFNINDAAFIRLIGIEKADISVTCYDKASEKIFNDISQMKHVNKAVRLMSNSMQVILGNKEITPEVFICNDYNGLRTKTIVDGRYPKHDNEIAVTNKVAKQLNAKIGDVITLKSNNCSKEFVIVGVTQQISYLGNSASITENGMKRINSGFIPNTLNIYLDNSKNNASVRKAIKEKYKDQKPLIINMKEYFDTILASYNSAVFSICIAGIIFTICFVALILYLFINIKLMKERVHMGAYKALGYTTRQLVFQVIVSFCPVCIAGSAVGAILAMFLINPSFAACFSVSGILNSNLTIDPVMVLITFISLSLFSVLITTLVSMRVRKITPCELFL